MWRVVCLCLFSAVVAEDFELTNGLKVVEVPGDGVVDGRSSDGSLVGNFREFLATHELQLKLDELLPHQDVTSRSLKGALAYLNGLDNGEWKSGAQTQLNSYVSIQNVKQIPGIRFGNTKQASKS